MRRCAASSLNYDVRVISFANSIRGNTCAIASIVARLTVAIRAAVFALLLGASLPLAAQTTGSVKFIPTFLIYYGGGPTLVAADAPNLAKFDLIDIDRFRYQDIASNTLAAPKTINPHAPNHFYQNGPAASTPPTSTPPLAPPHPT